MIPTTPNLRVPTLALAGAVLFALIQATLPNGIGPLDTFLMFANGLAVAIYATLIRRDGPEPRRISSCIAYTAVALTHFAWLVPFAMLTHAIVVTLGVPGSVSSTGSLFLTTGLVFGAIIAFDLRSLPSSLIMLAAVFASAALAFTEPFWRGTPKNPPHIIGLPALPLHVGIALALFLAALREQRKHRPGFCPTCGYDLRGLSPDAACPECGSAGKGPRGLGSRSPVMRSIAALGALGVVSAAAAQTPGFHLVGFPPGTDRSIVRALSQSGEVAAGFGSSSTGILPAFTSTAANGRYDFGLEPGMPYRTPATGLDSTGTVIVGEMNNLGFPARAYRRAGSGPLQDLGPLLSYQTSHAMGVSGDGNTVVGRGETQILPSGLAHAQAFRWTQQSGMQPLGFLSPSHQYSVANAISRDGSTIVGVSSFDSGTSGAAFVWRQGTGMEGLPPLPGSTTQFSGAGAATADGSIIVGTAITASGSNHAVRWTPSGIHDLGLVSGWGHSGASAVSDDGLVVAGWLSVGNPNPASFIWTPVTGMLLASDYLALHDIAIPAGWTISEVYALSGDGLTFAGWARSNSGTLQGFVATVPAPASIIVVLPALMFLRSRRGLTAAICPECGAAENRTSEATRHQAGSTLT